MTRVDREGGWNATRMSAMPDPYATGSEDYADSMDMSRKGCMYHHPMAFCTECGCWMNCKRDGIDAEYRRRPDNDGENQRETDFKNTETRVQAGAKTSST